MTGRGHRIRDMGPGTRGRDTGRLRPDSGRRLRDPGTTGRDTGRIGPSSGLLLPCPFPRRRGPRPLLPCPRRRIPGERLHEPGARPTRKRKEQRRPDTGTEQPDTRPRRLDEGSRIPASLPREHDTELRIFSAVSSNPRESQPRKECFPCPPYKSVHRSIAVLKLPKPVGSLITLAQRVVTAMTGNPAFPSPVPTLAVVLAGLTDLQPAEQAALSRLKG